MNVKNWENDIKELTVLGKDLFGKTQVLITKIAQEMQKDAMKRLNEFKENFDKTMRIMLKHGHRVPAEEVPIT
jgi:hypothetical protein